MAEQRPSSDVVQRFGSWAEADHLGYVVASIGKSGRVSGFASGKIGNFREAHAELRAFRARGYHGDWRVIIVRGLVR